MAPPSDDDSLRDDGSASSSSDSDSYDSAMNDNDGDSDSDHDDGSADEEMNDDDDGESVSASRDNEQPPERVVTQDATLTHAPVTTAFRPTLSKSWAMQSSHVPIYTGGKVIVATAHVTTTRNVQEQSKGDHDTMEQDVDATTVTTSMPLLLLPVAGNLCVVDASRGQRLVSVRPDDALHDEDDDQDEGVDQEAITAYCCTNTNHSIKKQNESNEKQQQAQDTDLRIFTCSRNLVLKQYRLVPPAARNATLPSWSVLLEQSLGKSGHTLPVTLMQLHCSNAFLATGSVDGSVRVWDVRAKFVTHVFRVNNTDSDNNSGRSVVTALEWMPRTKHLVLAVGRESGSVTIHDLRDAQQQHVVTLIDHVSAVTCLKWTPDVNVLVTGGRDAVLNLWSMREETTVANKKQSKLKNIAAPPFTKTVYERMHTLPVYEQMEGMAMLHVGNETVVATAGSKGCVRLYRMTGQGSGDDNNAAESSVRLELMDQQPAADAFGDARGGYLDLSLCFVNHGHDNVEQQLLVADAENNLTFLSLQDKVPMLKTKRTIVGHNDDILDLKVVPGETTNRIVVATNSSKVSLFDLDDFSCHVLDRHTATVLCVDVSPCGRYVATCGKDRRMLLWNIGGENSKHACVGSAIGHTEAVGAVALSRKRASYDVTGKAAQNGGGSFAVTASVDRTIKRWNLPGTKVLNGLADESEPVELQAFHSARAHEKDINIVSIAPNDSLIATGSQDKTIKLWRASDLSLQATLKGHKRGVWDCQFSLHDRVLASCSGDKTIKLWSLSEKYSCLRTFQGHLASVLRVRFVRGGLQLLSSGADGLIKLWTIRTSECEATMDGHSAKVWAMDLSPSGDVLVSGGGDSKIAVWGDVTKDMDESENAEKAEAVLLDQRLANHLRHKEYSDAFAIALQRDKPLHVLKILTAIIDDDVEKGGSGLDALKREAKKWSDDGILQILRYCRDWNTRARNSHVAMLVCKALVSVVPVPKLVKINGVPEIVAGIIPYAERHFDRLDRLYASTFLLDFILNSMGGIEASSDVTDDFALWESSSRLVLPPQGADGRKQVGGMLVSSSKRLPLVGTPGVEDSDDLMTVGDSDSSDDEE
ncbi:hypothetical protein MPSEU_000062700 [Mayamaea pseudoterrestris]|nr:hypothetical protein MPSEU_000062700 [Mayamaea pseudoterrestris]